MKSCVISSREGGNLPNKIAWTFRAEWLLVDAACPQRDCLSIQPVLSCLDVNSQQHIQIHLVQLCIMVVGLTGTDKRDTVCCRQGKLGGRTIAFAAYPWDANTYGYLRG